jgi:hypothetical protein
MDLVEVNQFGNPRKVPARPQKSFLMVSDFFIRRDHRDVFLAVQVKFRLFLRFREGTAG